MAVVVLAALRLKPVAAGESPIRAVPSSDRPTPSARSSRTEAEIVDVLEEDVAGVLGFVTAATAAARRDIAATHGDLGQVQNDAAALIEAGREAAARAAGLAAWTERLAARSGDITGAVEQAGAGVGEAADRAARAESLLSELVRVTEDLAAVAESVAAVARQSNLVALNATVEAARAGPAGRGFASVASDVKALSAEASRAAGDIKTRISRLRGSADGSIAAVGHLASAIHGVRPVLDGVRAALHGQGRALSALGERALETRQCVEQVSERAQLVDGSARDAGERATTAQEAVELADRLGAGLGTRVVTVLRQNELGDRRREPRFPIDLRADLSTTGQTVVTHTVDVSRNGVLLAPPEGLTVRPGSSLDLDLQFIGPVTARVVAVSPNGLHCSFGTLPAATRERVGTVVGEIEAQYRPLVKLAQNTARQVAFVIEQAVADGHLTREQVFDTEYRPVPNTHPQQFETAYLSVLEDLLPAIQEPLLASDANMVFCIATDRNGYVPVHNRKYAQPPREGARSLAPTGTRRILDDHAGIMAARSKGPFVLQAYRCDLGAGLTAMIREVDAPIRLFGRHWGGFRTAYRL